MKERVIIVGAGAAGLMAAKILAEKGKLVTVLEARERIGGRIFTLVRDDFSEPVEVGAEFVHGDPPLTMALLKESGAPYQGVKGKSRTVKNGDWIKESQQGDDWDEMEDRLKAQQVDMPFDAFLDKYFADTKHASLREHAVRFAEGFDLADISKASTLALRDEWLHEESTQYRIEGGYEKLVQYMEDSIIQNEGSIHRSCIVKKIEWQSGKVKLSTALGDIFEADKCIVTVPLGVLTAAREEEAFIEFQPSVASYINAAKQIGYGDVVKLLLEFKEPFWEKWESKLGFLMSEGEFPVWWTQQPSPQPMLTAWLGGPKATALKGLDEITLLAMALDSLADIFSLPAAKLRTMLCGFYYHNWSTDPFSLGGYSYALPETAEALRLLMQPLENTLFFAGEAIYKGASPATVEAALESGRMVATMAG